MPGPKRIHWKAVGGFAALVVGTAVAWDTPLVFPLKALVVFFHELSHALAAIATGGSVEEIVVVAELGGHCITRGGSRFLTLSAGYLGSLVWGGAILLAAARTRLDRGIAMALGAILIAVTLLFVRPLASFGFAFGAAAGLGLLLAGRFLSERVNDFLLRWIGLTSCVYAVLDIKSDVLDRPELRSDARMLAELTHTPTLLWGVVWIATAVVVGGAFLVWSCRTDEAKAPAA